jgi:hypothetical protein
LSRASKNPARIGRDSIEEKVTFNSS